MTFISILNKSNHALPQYQTIGASGMDVMAYLTEDYILQPLERKLIPTGIYIAIPEGFEIQLRPRSGLALKHGITLLNSPATIDSDYRGEIQVLLINLGQEPFTITSGMRIAQMVCSCVEPIQWVETQVLTPSERGENGFGYTKW